MDGKIPDLIAMRKPRPSVHILQSVQYRKGSLIQVPKSHQITECRNGHIVLKSDDHEELKVWNPFLRRNAWVVVPQYEVHAEERFLVSALVPGETDGNFCLLVLSLAADTNCTESTVVLLKIFSSSTKSWRVANTVVQLNKILHPYVVHAGGFIYYLSLSQGNKSIIQINSQTLFAVVIPVPIGCQDADLMISRTGGNLSLCKSDRKRINGKRVIVVFLFTDGQWQESWRHEVPEASYWTRLIGFAEENSLIIVGIGCDEIRTLNIERGIWTDLEDHRVKACFAVEMDSPFRYPFTAGSLDIDEAYFETITTESAG